MRIVGGESGVVRSVKEVTDVMELDVPGLMVRTERDDSGRMNCPSGLNAERKIGRATSKAVRLWRICYGLDGET